MISIADVALPLPTPAICERVDRDISIERMQILTGRSWPGYGMIPLAVPTAFRHWPPDLKLNHYYHPTSASRWGSGLFLANKDAVDQIHPYAFGGDGSETNKVDLVISSEDAYGNLIEGVTIPVTVFPPIPLYRVVQPDGSSDMGAYLLYVCDSRFFWWDKPLPDLTISESGGVTWANVISTIQTALGVTLNYSPIPAEYLAPSRALNLTGEPIPPVLDSICANLGFRLTCAYDGTVFLQSFSDALNDFNNDITNNPDRLVRAGGPRYLGEF